MRNPTYRTRTYLLTIVVLVGFGALLARLYHFQIERQDEFRKLVPGSRTVTVREPGVRGEITDRNGVVLARNRRNYEVKFDLQEIYQAWQEQYSDQPKREVLATRDGMLRASDEVDIAEIVNRMVVPRLKQIGDRHDVDLVRNYSSKALRTHFLTHRGLVPFTYRSDLDYDEFATLAEHNLDLPGVEVSLRPVRVYPFRALASHILGYVKQWEKGDIPDRAQREFDHYIGEDKGVAGVEATMDDFLRGPEGIQRILKDEKGRVVGMVDYHRPEVGARVELTIDARRQYLVESVLRRAGRAAAVVIDVNTGAVLAMGSVPDYDPNRFVPSISRQELAEYKQNPASPFTNRAITGLTPGSTYKIPTALAGALNGLARNRYTCNGYVAYGDYKCGCWLYNSYGGAHGTLALSEAIQRSCNPFSTGWPTRWAPMPWSAGSSSSGSASAPASACRPKTRASCRAARRGAPNTAPARS
jgi:penicillin-binding protein 2